MALLHNPWFTQSVGVIALVCVILAWNARSRKNIFILQSVNLALFIIHYTLLAAYAGAVVLGRNVVFMRKSDQRWASRWIWPYLFSLLATSVLIAFWNGWVTILPVFAVGMSMYAMWKDEPAQMRFFMLLSCLVWIPYTIIIQSLPGLLSQAVGIIGLVIGVYRLDRRNVRNLMG